MRFAARCSRRLRCGRSRPASKRESPATIQRLSVRASLDGSRFAAAGLTRLTTLVSMHPNAPREIEPLIGEAVDIIVHIARKEGGRVVREILEVIDFDRTNQVCNWRTLSY
jgi:hypothetical protein